MASDHVLLTVSGPDRPGIVAGVAEALLAARCNLEDSSMTRLRGAFAILLIVRLGEGVDAAALEARLAETARDLGLTISLRPLTPEEAARPAPSGATPVLITLFGADHPGIVAPVARLLADRGVNVTDLSTEVVGSPEKPVYAMVIEAESPVGASELEAPLAQLARELACDVAVKEIEEYRL
ncbi:MAG: amino acid-binding protein [Nitrospirae bacterium]|nr:MAG: amino acid-binding protein [Nitrospirota bacterium]